MKNNFFDIIKKYFIFLFIIFFMLVSFVLFSIIALLYFFQLLIILYSGFIFFKFINKKIIQYNYEKTNDLKLFVLQYGLLSLYFLIIYFFCTHKFFGLSAIILLLFFIRALKKRLY